MFAYNAQVGCDKHGWALAYSIDAGNVHDSQAFLALFEQLERLQSDYLIADSGYKTPSIAKFLLDQNITPVFPYTRPRGKKGSFALRTLSMMTTMTVIFALKIKC